MSAHENVFNEGHYGCKICGAKYHCEECHEGCGKSEHHVSDAQGPFYSCQEPVRAELARQAWITAINERRILRWT